MKVAIVGAGINGLFLARKLAERGEEVTIFESKEKIGKECCSGLFSRRILEFIPESEKLIQNEINFCLIHFPKKTLKIDFFRPFLVINHFQLDNLAADLAKEAGVKIILKNSVKKESFELLEVKYERLIGCDGANSIVRKNLNLSEPEMHLGIQGFIPGENRLNYVETWPTVRGFIWKIPRGEKTEYGIMENPAAAKKIFENFLNKNNLELNNIKSAVIPQGGLIIPSNPKITLCGDAAGLTKPWSGGGVVWGLKAAEILLKNFPDFLKYQKEIKKYFSSKIVLGKLIKRKVYFLGFNLPWLLPKYYSIESDFLI